MSEEKDNKTEFGKLSRREFLRDAGIVVGGTAVGSAFFLSACGKEVEVTKTVTTTAPGVTNTITTTAPGTTSTKTVTTTAGGSTQTVTKYTCPACNQEFTSLEALKAHFDSVHGEIGVNENVVKFTVNGEKYETQVDPTWSLKYVLHDKLGFVSIKEMCTGHGACGSCTVIMDGRPILSCLALAIECEGAQIETSEGIAADNHPLIEEYVMGNCMQCGYCTPGFVVTAKALLDKHPNPTQEEILIALSGNVCRCATYPMHIPAIQQAAAALKGGN